MNVATVTTKTGNVGGFAFHRRWSGRRYWCSVGGGCNNVAVATKVVVVCVLVLIVDDDMFADDDAVLRYTLMLIFEMGMLFCRCGFSSSSSFTKLPCLLASCCKCGSRVGYCGMFFFSSFIHLCPCGFVRLLYREIGGVGMGRLYFDSNVFCQYFVRCCRTTGHQMRFVPNAGQQEQRP